MSIIGYARVSTTDQNLDGQLAALKAAGAAMIFREKISGVRADRPQLKKMVSALTRGDLVIVTRLDRLALAAGVRLGRKPKLLDFQRKEAVGRRGNGETLA